MFCAVEHGAKVRSAKTQCHLRGFDLFAFVGAFAVTASRNYAWAGSSLSSSLLATCRHAIVPFGGERWPGRGSPLAIRARYAPSKNAWASP